MGFVVRDTFAIGDKLVVSISETVGPPPGQGLHAHIRRPNGEELDATANPVHIKRTEQPEMHGTDFWLVGLATDAVPIGSEIEFEPVPDWTPAL